MKLVTDLTPRADGSIKATVGANNYAFKAGADGRLACEVPDDDALVLLDTGNFYPETEDDADPSDEADAALEAAQAAYDADPSDENAAALEAAQNAVNALAEAKPKAKSKGKAKAKK